MASDLFDMEPLKEKTAVTTLKAFKKMFKREYIKKPKASMSVDAGGEFKEEFAKYLFNQSIFKKTAVVGRHSQNSTVESLNRQLGRLFNGYMNMKETETEQVYREWDDVLDTVRTELNKYRKKNNSSKSAVQVGRHVGEAEIQCGRHRSPSFRQPQKCTGSDHER